MKHARNRLMMACALPALGLFAPAAMADPLLPSGGTVASGSVSIITSDPANTLLVQKSQSAIINWQNFSIGAGASVTFQQPDGSSIALNRVTGTSASAINGSLLANGQVWLVNANGILFGQGSRIDVGGLIATTSDMKDEDFLSGHYAFGIASANPDAAVINRGSIKAATGGSAVLSAAHVVNEGVIEARLGHVVLGGASSFSVDFDGDNLIRYQITAPVSQTPKDGDGKAAPSLVSNSGTVMADGGTVLMTARAARNVVDNVINTTGIIQANAVSVQNGEVVLDAGEDGAVQIAGAVEATGQKAGESGGTIQVEAGKIDLADGAKLDASGAAGGGVVRIGSMDTTQSVTVGKSVVAADATATGKGGSVAILSGGKTRVAAAISAKGVTAGGTVETSGQDLAIEDGAMVDTSALNGATGLWLLDPVNVDIDATTASNIVNSIASTNVNVTASNDINVLAPVVYNSANSLALLAGHNLTVNANVLNSGSGGVLAVAGWDGVTSAANIFATPGAYGNGGGSVLIGGAGAFGRIALGSRLGPTAVAAHDLTIAATNLSAQLGYRGSSPTTVDTTGSISVLLNGKLTLTGGDVTQTSYAEIGHGGNELSGNQAGDIAITVAGPVTVSGGTAFNSYARIGNGGTAISSTASGSVILAAGGDVTLSSGSTITAGGTGDALVLATAGNFVNQVGPAALTVSGGGRWLVFLNAPANNLSGGLTASPYYNRSFNFSTDNYAPVTGAGNRFVYALAPVVTITIADKAKTYGTANPALTATITGGLPQDAAAGVYTGSPVLQTAATASSGAGNYAITGSLGTLFSDFNYGFQFVNGTLHIDPAVLTASLTGTVRKTFDGTTAASLAASNYLLSGVIAGDSVTLNQPASGLYDNANAGTGKTVSVSGLSVSGNGNYILSSSSISGAVGVIDPAVLTVSLTGTVQKLFDGTTTATLSPSNYTLSGVITGFGVTLNNPAAGSYDSPDVGTGKTVSVGGLVLSGSSNYVLSSSSVSGAVGTITAPITPIQPIPPQTPTAPPTLPVPNLFDATAAINEATLRIPTSTNSTSVIDGLLVRVPGGGTPHGVPPYGQVYSSWGNEAFWQ